MRASETPGGKEIEKRGKMEDLCKKNGFPYTEEDAEHTTKQTPTSVRHLAATKSVSVYERMQERDSFILISIMPGSSLVPWDL